MSETELALSRYAGGTDHIAEIIAQAWAVLSMVRINGDGKSGRDCGDGPEDIPEYLDHEWAKMAGRMIAGYAEANVRPKWGIFDDPIFDQFRWKTNNAEEQ